MKPKIGICYLCGDTKEVTDDHLPSKSIAPKEPDSAFLHVPACRDCNGKYSHEESKFRDVLATAGYGKGIKTADDAFDAMKRNFNRNPIGEIIYKTNKDRQRILSCLELADIYSPNGGVYLGRGYSLKMPKDVDYKSVLYKYARGLHYLFTKEVVPNDYRMLAKHIINIEHPEIYNMCQYTGHAGDFFHFRGGVPNDDNKSSVWYMLFYKSIGFFVMFLRPKVSKGQGDNGV